MNAPTCPISRNQAIAGMPGRVLPVPPRALDLPSLIAATNALRDLVLAMFGPGTPLNNMPLLYGLGVGPGGNRLSPKQDPGLPFYAVLGQWTEHNRTTEPRRIVYKHGEERDKEIFVDVNRLYEVVFNWGSIPEEAFHWLYMKPSDDPDEG